MNKYAITLRHVTLLMDGWKLYSCMKIKMVSEDGNQRIGTVSSLCVRHFTKKGEPQGAVTEHQLLYSAILSKPYT